MIRYDVLFVGASEPKNMAYMNRLGLWGEGTPFREFSDFIQAVEKRYGCGICILICTHIVVSDCLAYIKCNIKRSHFKYSSTCHERTPSGPGKSVRSLQVAADQR